MLKFQNVTKTYKPSSGEPVFALSDITFSLNNGEFVCLVGKSGAGKTTIVKLITAQEKPTQGKVLFQDIDIFTLKQSALQQLRRRIGVVHQDYKLLFDKTVKENLSFVMQVIGVSDSCIKRDLPQVLEIVGLEQRAANFPDELSGGEKQRLAIARALVHRPEIIIADEPTGNLDFYNSYQIIDLFKKINSLGTTIILATHDKEIVNSLKKRVITLGQGKIIRDDPLGRFIL